MSQGKMSKVVQNRQKWQMLRKVAQSCTEMPKYDKCCAKLHKVAQKCRTFPQSRTKITIVAQSRTKMPKIPAKSHKNDDCWAKSHKNDDCCAKLHVKFRLLCARLCNIMQFPPILSTLDNFRHFPLWHGAYYEFYWTRKIYSAAILNDEKMST